jgi:hypothetical protein
LGEEVAQGLDRTAFTDMATTTKCKRAGIKRPVNECLYLDCLKQGECCWSEKGAPIKRPHLREPSLPRAKGQEEATATPKKKGRS